MRNLLNNKLLLIIIVFTMSGCRKDSPTVEISDNSACTQDCADFPQAGELGYFFHYSGDQYTHPQFNPNNPNEFIYIRVNEDESLTELVRYDMNSKTEQVLLNDLYITGKPQWSKTGWITFHAIDRKIWKIKDNGSELTQLTYGVKDLHPHFNFSHDLICYDRQISYSNAELEENPNLRKEHKMIFIDLNGATHDSITVANITNTSIPVINFQTWTVANFQENAIYFYGGVDENNGIYLLNQVTKKITTVDVWSFDSSKDLHLDIEYHQGYLYYTKFRNSLTRLNVCTGTEKVIKCGCHTNYYDIISVSPDGNKLLVEKIISTPDKEDESTIDEQHEIWMMDLDGCNEIKILGD